MAGDPAQSKFRETRGSNSSKRCYLEGPAIRGNRGEELVSKRAIDPDIKIGKESFRACVSRGKMSREDAQGLEVAAVDMSEDDVAEERKGQVRSGRKQEEKTDCGRALQLLVFLVPMQNLVSFDVGVTPGDQDRGAAAGKATKDRHLVI
ncbi:hypothetical protein NM208_g9756 [Fusarium decemcellulare]|uniref:Uncharacterized protein n=1 Tax=Fusarium decemcellulare TaxID=57161 RepID=A0ACC1S0H9_9HYPO|nr:hypothetical protein NM208_g9756 [Fusarium decemcellulare]